MYTVQKKIDRKSIRRNKNAGQNMFFTSGREVKVETPEGVKITRQVHPIYSFDPVPEFSYQYLTTTLTCGGCKASFEDLSLYYPEDEGDMPLDPQCPECFKEISVNFEFEKLTQEELAAIADNGPVPCETCMTPDACRAFGCACRPVSEGGAPDIQFELLKGGAETDLEKMKKMMAQIKVTALLTERDHWVHGKVQKVKVMDLRGPKGHSFAPWVALIFDLEGKLIDMEVEI